MKDEILRYTDVRESGRARKVSIKYRKGRFTIVKPESLKVDKKKVVERNIDWLSSRMERARRYRSLTPSYRFEEGEVFEVLGEEKEVVIERRRSNTVEDDIFLAEHLVDSTSVKEQLEKSLRAYAKNVFEAKAAEYSESIDGEYEKIYVRDQDTRWGSCSGKANLNFNWRLVLGPEKVLDYVVAHELVHLEERNHGPRFWNRLEEVFPDREDAEKWLDNFSAKLEFDTDF